MTILITLICVLVFVVWVLFGLLYAMHQASYGSSGKKYWYDYFITGPILLVLYLLNKVFK